MDSEIFISKVGEYRTLILESLGPATSAQARMERELKATGWSVMAIIVGIYAGMRGILRRIDNFWSREDLAEAVEKYVVDLLITGKGNLEQRLQERKALHEVHLRADEESRAHKRILNIMRDVLINNPDFKDILA